MARIPAADNLTIEMEANRWRLLVNGDGPERVLMEANSGQPLRYLPTFGYRRRLPDTGALPTAYIQRVVLGWSGKDEAWHLGLLLEPELAQARGSRWCEIAHWPDPERDLYAEIASKAGTGLAEAITRPFSLIPPSEPAAAPAAPAKPLPELPIPLDQWRLEQVDARTLQFKLSPAWARSRLLRVIWYTLWTAVYVLLSITTLQGRIALPRPEFLPYLGLVSAGVLALLILALIVQLLTHVNRIVVDADMRTIRGLHGNREKWRLSADELRAVYVSQVVSRKPRRGKQTIHYGELNLQLRDGSFRSLLEHNQTEEKSSAFDGAPNEDRVMPLTPDLVDSGLQAAGFYVARALNVPCLYDQRLK